MVSKDSLFLLLLLFDVGLILAIDSKFLDIVKTSALLHHKETNTVWEYLGTYAQTETTVNYILEIPVFQFMCDVLPVSMAFAMQTCAQYRSRILDNGSARRLNDLFEAHVGKHKKRQIGEIALAGTAVYGAYKIIGDLFGRNNKEMINRLEESENFQKHQEKLNNVLTTSISSLEDNNLVILKSFKSLFDSVNATRSLIHSLLKISLKQQRTFTGWAKFSLKSEMRRHYEQMISAFSRVANHDLNLEMFSPEQRIFVHDFLWNRIRSNLPLNFSASLAQFVPNLLMQQIISFVQVNESEIMYELKEQDFHFLVETDSLDTPSQNETIDLDSILPKIVAHARIENFFSIPTNFHRKKMDLFKITRLPLFADETKAFYTANLPRFLALADDGSSSEWSDDGTRKCTVDKESRYTFCSIPLPIFSSIQHPCLRSIILYNSTKNCLKETVELFSPHVVKIAPNIHAVSVHRSLQCFEKGDNTHKNVFSNITRVGIIRTRCSGFVSCGSLDFVSVGSACDRVESYMFSFNSSSENPFRLDKSVNPLDIVMDNLSPMMDIPSLIESALSHKKHIEDVHTEFESNIHRTIKKKTWPKVLIAMLVVISIVTVFTILFASKSLLKRISCVISLRKMIGYLFDKFFSKNRHQVDHAVSKMCVHDSMLSNKDIYNDFTSENRRCIDSVQPPLREIICDDSLHYSVLLSNSKKPSVLKSNVASDYSPLMTHKCVPIDSLNILSPKIIRKKTNPKQRKIYDHVRKSSDLPSNFSSITSRDFEENLESEE